MMHNSYRGVLSDAYFLNEKEIKMHDEMMGIETKPVDMNAACVEEKEGTGMQNHDLSKIQYSVRERFGMRSKKDLNEEGGGY